MHSLKCWQYRWMCLCIWGCARYIWAHQSGVLQIAVVIALATNTSTSLPGLLSLKTVVAFLSWNRQAERYKEREMMGGGGWWRERDGGWKEISGGWGKQCIQVDLMGTAFILLTPFSSIFSLSFHLYFIKLHIFLDFSKRSQQSKINLSAPPFFCSPGLSCLFSFSLFLLFFFEILSHQR